MRQVHGSRSIYRWPVLRSIDHIWRYDLHAIEAVHGPPDLREAFLPSPMSTEKPVRVCIVEDDTTIRETLTTLLASERSLEPIGSFATGEAALKAIPALAPDVVIMDIGLPGITGIELVRELVPALPRTQFLMFSMHDDDQRVFDALKTGAHGYVLKGCSSAQVISAVHELHEGGAPMSASIARRVVANLRAPLPAPTGLTELSTRENEVLELLAEGLLYKEIADRLGISQNTVGQHVHRIYGKLHVQNRTEALNKYFGR